MQSLFLMQIQLTFFFLSFNQCINFDIVWQIRLFIFCIQAQGQCIFYIRRNFKIYLVSAGCSFALITS